MSDMIARIRQRSQRPNVERDRSLAGQDRAALEADTGAAADPPAESESQSDSEPEQEPAATTAAKAEEKTETKAKSKAKTAKAKQSNTTRKTNAKSKTADEPPAPLTPDELSMQLDADLAALPQVAARRNIRLEAGLDESLSYFCYRSGITIETFLEAAYLACEQDAKLRKAAIAEAKQRLQRRKEAGKLRRLYSQMRNAIARREDAN